MLALFYTVMSLFLIVCFLLMMLVLIQKGRGGGLASAFGGGGGHTPFGAKTGDVLTWTTSVFFGVFLLLACCLTPIGDNLQLQKEKEDAQKAELAKPKPVSIPLRHSIVIPNDAPRSLS